MRVLRTLLASAACVALGVAGLAWATDGFAAFTTQAAKAVEVREHPPRVPAVELETQSGARLDLASLRGRWLLVDFMYTRCMTYCSVLGADDGELQRALAAPLAADRLRLVSVSFDPAHDTPAALAGYIRRFHGRPGTWLAARPVDGGGLRELERVFGVSAIPDGIGGYTHTATFNLVDPDGRLVRILGVDESPEAVRDAVLEAMR